MNLRTVLPVALALSALSLPALAQQHPLAPAPSHWKLNASASDFGGMPPYTASSTTLTSNTETNLRWRHSNTDSKGTTSGSWIGAYDGKLRPVTGIKGEKFSIQRDGTFHIDEADGTTIDGTIITADDLKTYTEDATVKTKDGQEHHIKLVYDRVK
ncbi:MAG TPA: hypothetical protein VFW30_00545 [Bryocella sp.]|nr:hypothetical protein [Bryocella sp.]